MHKRDVDVGGHPELVKIENGDELGEGFGVVQARVEEVELEFVALNERDEGGLLHFL